MRLYCIKQHDITDCGAACLAAVSAAYDFFKGFAEGWDPVD